MLIYKTGQHYDSFHYVYNSNHVVSSSDGDTNVYVMPNVLARGQTVDEKVNIHTINTSAKELSMVSSSCEALNNNADTHPQFDISLNNGYSKNEIISNVTICALNVGGLNSKTDNGYFDVFCKDFDVICLSETNTNQYDFGDTLMNDYIVFSCDDTSSDEYFSIHTPKKKMNP